MRNDHLAATVALLVSVIWTVDAVFDVNVLTHPKGSKPVVEFAEVRPIFEARCLPCHEAPHWNWTDYDVAHARRHTIKSRVWVFKNMPPDSRIEEEERKLIRDWVNGGGSP